VTRVNTVRGPIESERLGFTLMHEHVVTLDPGLREVWPETFDRAAIVRQAAEALRAARAAGVDTLVDLTAFDLGRDVPLIEEAARAADVQVLVASGSWLFPPRYFHLRAPDEVARLYARDVEEGIQGTAIKAAIFKLACNDAVVAGPFEVVFRAVARAHRRTGAPISTHTDTSQRSGLDQQRILAEEGVDLTRVIIGHSGDTEDLDYLKRLLDRGSTLGMDRFGMDHFAGRALLTTPQRVAVIAALCRAGYAGQIVLSHDASGYSASRTRAYAREHWPHWDFTHIPRDVVPALREAGVSEAQVEQMTRGNPRRVFERVGAY